jgi:hypothetical protein
MPTAAQSSLAPAVIAINGATKELFDSRAPNEAALFKKILIAKKDLLAAECGKYTPLVSAYALIKELERQRAANLYGMDTEASHVSYVIYTLHQNYMHVFDNLREQLPESKIAALTKRLRKLSM